MEDEADKNLSALLELDLEYRLTVAHRLSSTKYGNCDCGQYLINRRTVLIPEIMKRALVNGTDPVIDFVKFAHRLHDRHTEA